MTFTTWNQCTTSGCGVSSYNECQHADCGKETYYTTSSGSGTFGGGSINANVCGSCSMSESHLISADSSTTTWGWTCKCSHQRNKTCRTAACGIQSYNTCRHSECGCQSYNRCSACGCESVNTCWH